ncbi:MAG: heme o synthase [Planctomycetota bacterium]|nr:heme o synthase [Planctomycetota bacterium]
MDPATAPPTDAASPTLNPSLRLGARVNTADIIELTKPGIVKLVVVTSAVGFAMAALGRGLGDLPITELIRLGAGTLLGTALSAAGANALNQAMEVRRDSAMHRTRERPLPAGRMRFGHGVVAGVVLSAAGLGALLLLTNVVAAAVSAATILTYIVLYTPMKPVTPLATWVGAVPGALPPLIGWSAASEGALRGLDEAGGWTIFLIMFAWQIPHFLAIAWKYREDYARGGHRVFPVVDPSGVLTAWTSVLWTVVMVVASITPLKAMDAGLSWVYGVVAAAGGAAMLVLAVRLLRRRDDASARRLFFGSIIYLPVLLAAMVADAAGGLFI